jgi:hypothetical protein
MNSGCVMQVLPGEGDAEPPSGSVDIDHVTACVRHLHRRRSLILPQSAPAQRAGITADAPPARRLHAPLQPSKLNSDNTSGSGSGTESVHRDLNAGEGACSFLACSLFCGGWGFVLLHHGYWQLTVQLRGDHCQAVSMSMVWSD